MNSEYYVDVDGMQEGPFVLNELSRLYGEGKLKRDTFVWKEGADDWQEAKDLVELSFLFDAPTIPTATNRRKKVVKERGESKKSRQRSSEAEEESNKDQLLAEIVESLTTQFYRILLSLTS